MRKHRARVRRSRYPRWLRHKRGSAGIGGLMTTVAGAAIYGALRAKMSNALLPLTSKIPLGNISDEVGIGALLVIADKTLARKAPMLKPFIQGGIIIESARIGEAIVTGQVGMQGQQELIYGDNTLYG